MINHSFQKLHGMTFDPSIDCRNDLVNFYGYSKQQVNSMSDDELFSIMDQIEASEKGYDEYHPSLPVHLQNEKCSCGSPLKVLYVDCETRGDCSIYVCECVKCSTQVCYNYAEEWYEFDETDMIYDLIRDIDNACFDNTFEKANQIAKETYEKIMNSSNLDKQSLLLSLNSKIDNLTKRYNISFNLV